MNLQDFKYMFAEGRDQFNNKTLTYLAPVLQHYGTDFMKLLHGLKHTGIFMDDLHWRIVADNHDRYYLFVLVNAKLSSNFNETITKLKNTVPYVGDYPFGELFGGELHAIIFKVPEQYHGAYNIMLDYMDKKTDKVPYSKMYTHDEINRLFVSLYGANSKPVKVLMQDAQYRKVFESYLNKLAVYAEDYRGTESVSLITLYEDSELDYLPNRKEEILNYPDND